MLRKLMANLPMAVQQELRRVRFRRQVKSNVFVTGEPEFSRLENWLRPGDWVIDIGANIGHYTTRLSKLVGNTGRVIAFEPIPVTFEILAANVAASGAQNVTLINAAVSAHTTIANMTVPKFSSGLDNFYEAKIEAGGEGVPVLCLTVDGLNIKQPVKLIKIDAEGHEASVLEGIRQLIQRDRPVLIIEGQDEVVAKFLLPFGYSSQVLPGSPNTIYTAPRPLAAHAAR